MAKFKERIEARKLRRQGKSVKEITKQLRVSKSSTSLWVRDIILKPEQLERLQNRIITGAARGRLLGSLVQKHRRLKKIKDAKNKGRKIIAKLTGREAFIAGLALYWAEGSRKSKEVSFCNSDPELIKFMLRWLNKSFNIPLERLYCCVGINEIHKPRDLKVKQYWSKITAIPLSQFNKTSFKKVKNKKIYANYARHYGTLTINLRRPSEFYYDIIGFIHGLAKAQIKN